jgi:hypothetical protein
MTRCGRELVYGGTTHHFDLDLSNAAAQRNPRSRNTPPAIKFPTID